ARALEEGQGDVFPGYTIADWLAMAKRCMAVGNNGRIHFDYDMKIADPIVEQADQPVVDLWPAIAALKDVPVALLRGELSDVLAPEVHQRMRAMLPRAEAVTVPGVGHAPMLDEVEAVAAIDRLLAQVA
ncbi:MAG: alpha/beta fold hydrolase, partial [Proteobacteria bacterium]|nr:alpha/beta fold hydrolase [Pseudomonadota bacterium]